MSVSQLYIRLQLQEQKQNQLQTIDMNRRKYLSYSNIEPDRTRDNFVPRLSAAQP